MTKGNGLAYVSLPGKGANDRFLSDIVGQLLARQVRVAGIVQANVERPDRAHCDMDVRVLPDGPLLRISEDRGALARGCRLNHGALEEAALALMDRIEDADILVLNKFGKQEAAGRGCVPAIAEAMARGIPVLIGVNGLNLAPFDDFAGGMATALPGKVLPVLAWCLDQVGLAPEPASQGNESARMEADS